MQSMVLLDNDENHHQISKVKYVNLTEFIV